MIVVADTSPICYLLLIGDIDLLRILFGKVIIPRAVRDELSVEGAPDVLRAWIAQPPKWIEMHSILAEPDETLDRLHKGESEAVMLAEQLGADLIVLDDKAAREVAAQRGLKVIGLLGILAEGAHRGLIHLPTAVDHLRQTTFRASPRILKRLLDQHQESND
jgi:predicted nucleic acid-binding protein